MTENELIEANELLRMSLANFCAVSTRIREALIINNPRASGGMSLRAISAELAHYHDNAVNVLNRTKG